MKTDSHLPSGIVPFSTPCVRSAPKRVRHSQWSVPAVFAIAMALVAEDGIAQVPVFDDFSAPTIDTTRWTVIPNPYATGPSAAFAQSGECVLENRGRLVTANQFDPALLGPLRVSGTFRFGGPDDYLTVMLRSDATPVAPFGNSANGIAVSVSWATAPHLVLGVQGSSVLLGASQLIAGSYFQPQVGTTYTFEVVDRGSTITASVRAGAQLMQVQAAVLVDTTTCKFIEWFNREAVPSSHQCFLDNLAIQREPQWIQAATPVAPPASYGCGFAFDEVLGKVLLFGGDGSGSSHNTTWTFDGLSWAQLFPATQPSPRTTRMVFDSVRSRMVMFGGWGGWFGHTNLSDLWEWDGVDWQQRVPALPWPPARNSNAIAFDRARGRVVIHGGRSSQPPPLGDTWEWDGFSWTQAFSAVNPPARWDHTMAYDEARGRVVLFGGANQSLLLAGTWTWDGIQWTQMQPSAEPTPRSNPGMAYDATRARIVLFGGDNALSFPSETWEWDGATWALSPQPTPPAGRWWPHLAYDRARATTVLYGGIASPGSGTPSSWMRDTWQRIPAVAASYTPFGSGCPGPTGIPVLAPVPGAAPRLGTSSQLRVSNLPTVVTVPIFVLGFSNTANLGPGGFYPLPLDLVILGWPGCQQLVSINDSYFYITLTGAAEHTIVVPPQSFLAGLSFYLQGLVLYSTGEVAVTNGVTGVAGY